LGDIYAGHQRLSVLFAILETGSGDRRREKGL
jgi:hypothetical protein